jgi:hypothetical protein
MDIQPMTQNGINIVKTLRQLRVLYQEIALLLETADGLMARKGWIAVGGTYVFAGLSYTLSQPQKWLQQDFFRLYKSHDWKNVLSFISVIVDDVERPALLTEPLLTAGCFDYGSGVEFDNLPPAFNYSLPRWHLKMPNRNDNGNLITDQPGPETAFTRVSTLGLPLLSISDTKTLERKIIIPLLANLSPES